MPRPMHRTRSWRRMKIRIPSGDVIIHYEKKKPSRAKCAICGAELHGVPYLRSSQLNKLTKTEKRPERPYGGVICSKCLAIAIKEAVRASIRA